MTNEQLAILIKQGEQERTPELWENVRKLLYKLSLRQYTAHAELFKQQGLAAEDIQQESYFAMLGAVKAYDPEKGYMFTTYLNLQLKRRIRDILRLNDPLNREGTRSLDAPLDFESEESDTLHDITADPTSGAGFESVDMSDYYTPLHKAIDSLPPADREIIELRFFSLPGAVMSYTDMGERLGISLECVRQRLNNALNKLRRGRMGVWLRKMYGDDYTTHTFGDSLTAYRRCFSSGVELRALARILYEERQQRVRSTEPLINRQRRA